MSPQLLSVMEKNLFKKKIRQSKQTKMMATLALW